MDNPGGGKTEFYDGLMAMMDTLVTCLEDTIGPGPASADLVNRMVVLHRQYQDFKTQLAQARVLQGL